MIQFDEDALRLSLPVARAVLEFASEDSKRFACSVGIDRGELCATDGQTAVRFEKGELGDGPDPSRWNGSFWFRSYVEEAVKAAGRSGTVELVWELVRSGFPALGANEPKNRSEFHEPILMDPTFLARVELVAKACRREREKGDGLELPPLPGVLLVSIASPVEPMRFQVGGPETSIKTAHVAWVTIMPMMRVSTFRKNMGKARKLPAEAKPGGVQKPKRVPRVKLSKAVGE